MPTVLTDAQVADYERDGFLVIPDAISPEDIAELQAVTSEFVERSRTVTEHTEVFDLEPAHTPEKPLLRRVKTPEKWHPTYARMVRHPKILGALEDLWGTGIRYQTSKLNMKVAGYGSSLEWHQDWAFYPHTNEDLAVVGIMIDDIDEDNGAMMIVPGSHRGPIEDHSYDGIFTGGIDPTKAQADFSKAISVCGKAGSISIHHVRAIHGGPANRSGRDRRYFLLQYTAADAWPLMDKMDWNSWRANLLTGEETWTPRMEALPVRLPLPEPTHGGSIYENQRDLKSRYFEDAVS
ncbi:MAG: phytanoyl-CoA dioxygenase family protein [Actinobacteria bacterium]|nr:phytanoyl-CoA dioxygenase family protein [Actinomycetota bacterium]